MVTAGSRGPAFLGMGAQKAATSWIYACLAEHPQIYMPAKEIHFFSKNAKWHRGYDWYESLFSGGPPGRVGGEFSTSYMAFPEAAERISRRYPRVRLFACLRNPIDRAFSNYMNDVMRGAVDPGISFEQALENHPEYIEQGRYYHLLEPFLERFHRQSLLLLVFDDIARDPSSFLKRIYAHIGVADHRPAALHRRINVSRRPRSVFLERQLIAASSLLQQAGLKKVWWTFKKIGIGDLLRRINSSPSGPASEADSLNPPQRRVLYRLFEDDIQRLSELIRRPLEEEWRP